MHLIGFIIRIYNDARSRECQIKKFNPISTELNLICYLLALLGAHHILHVSRIRVNIYFYAYSDWFLCSWGPYNHSHIIAKIVYCRSTYIWWPVNESCKGCVGCFPWLNFARIKFSTWNLRWKLITDGEPHRQATKTNSERKKKEWMNERVNSFVHS